MVKSKDDDDFLIRIHETAKVKDIYIYIPSELWEVPNLHKAIAKAIQITCGNQDVKVHKKLDS